MIIEYLKLLLIGMVVSALGGLPFGLVNLSVMNASLERGNREAFMIAHGAAIIEVVFGLSAILAGGLFYQYMAGNSIVSYIAAGVLIAGGIFFLMKRRILLPGWV